MKSKNIKIISVFLLVFLFIMLLSPYGSHIVHAVSPGDVVGTCTQPTPVAVGSTCGGSLILVEINEMPTCTSAGYGYAQCDRCGEGIYYDIPATGHSYGAETVIPATCTTNGSGTSTCVVCGNVSTRVIKASGHKYEVISEVSCTEDGKKVCKRCGHEEITPMTGHDYEQTDIVFSSCTEQGSMTEICTLCGDEKTEIITALGHKYQYETVDPTCTDDGHKTGVCQRCGDISDETIPAIGHDYPDEWTLVNESTIAREGLQTKTCMRCGLVLSEILPKKSPLPLIIGTVGGLSVTAGLAFGIKGIVKKRRLAKNLAEKTTELIKPELEDKVLTVCVGEEYNEFVDLLKSKHFLEVTRVEPEELAASLEESAPDLLIAQIIDSDAADSFPDNEIIGDTPVALIIPDDLFEMNAERFGRYDHVSGLKSANQGLVKLVLPILKPNLGSDESLDNIGLVADLLGIPVIPTVIDLFVNGRDIKSTIQDSEEIGVSETAVIISDIAAILGLDTLSGVAGLVDDVDSIKAAVDNEAGTNEVKNAAVGAADIVEVVSDLFE